MRERTIEQYLVERVNALGGECRKLKWIGRNGAPDRLVMLPMRDVTDPDNGFPIAYAPRTLFVELKAPGEKCRTHQLREHERMRRMGQIVVVVDSFEGVDELLM